MSPGQEKLFSAVRMLLVFCNVIRYVPRSWVSSWVFPWDEAFLREGQNSSREDPGKYLVPSRMARATMEV